MGSFQAETKQNKTLESVSIIKPNYTHQTLDFHDLNRRHPVLHYYVLPSTEQTRNKVTLVSAFNVAQINMIASSVEKEISKMK